MAVDAKHHLITAHEAMNVGNDRSQLSTIAKHAQAGSTPYGGVLVELDSVNGQAIGRYIIDSRFTLDFELPPGDCSAPGCPPTIEPEPT